LFFAIFPAVFRGLVAELILLRFIADVYLDLVPCLDKGLFESLGDFDFLLGCGDLGMLFC
jgi:hypothetical protein